MEPFSTLPSDRAAHAGRLPWPTPDELDPPRRAVYDRIVGGPRGDGEPAFALTDGQGRLHGPFNALLVAPAVGDAVQALGAALRYRTQLPDRCRELAILAVAAAHDSDFEWYAHAAVGRRVGLSEPVLAAVRAGRIPRDHLDGVEVVALEVTHELIARRDLAEDAYAAAVDTLGLEQLAELVTLVGYYQLLALVLEVWRTPLPAEASTAVDEQSPPGRSSGRE